jgi:ribose transport system ATP-binding protein
MSTPRLRITGIRKSYGPTAALRGVNLELLAGEVHALIGENGAGKSTLMKILSGAEQPDAGEMQLEGTAYNPSNPQAARARGVAMIYQELAVCPDLTVEANIMLGQELSTSGLLSHNMNRAWVVRALEQLGHPEISPDALVSSLNPAETQVVEIARALVSDVKVLVLDEPTSALTQQDAQRLFTLVKSLKSQGVTVVYISHFLEEVEAVADRFTVLRDGEPVHTDRVGAISRERIIEHMVGKPVGEQYPRTAKTLGEPVLELSALAGTPLPRTASFALHRGEILGIAGIVGSGRTELLRAIYGLDVVRSGSVRVGTFTSERATPQTRIAQGVGMVSEDRKTEGLALDLPIAENATLTCLNNRFGFLSLAKLRQSVAELLAKFGVKFRDANQAVGELSGGNQQKVSLARLFHQHADILLLDEPTKGVDIGSKADIYRQIGEAAATGKAVLIVSSYLPELFGICDTLAVMCRGELSPVRPVSAWTPEEVIAVATGA